MKLIAAIILFFTLVIACSRRSETSAAERRYPLSGKVVALNPQDHTATIDAAAIPNFMQAMTMEYPVRSATELNSLHVGDHVTATVNVLPEGMYYLSDIKRQQAPK